MEHQRSPPHCSVCYCPNITKRTCKHCWGDRNCLKFDCERCKQSKINYGKIVSVYQCPDCGYDINIYENGIVKASMSYESSYRDNGRWTPEYAYDDSDDEKEQEQRQQEYESSFKSRHTECVKCRILGIV